MSSSAVQLTITLRDIDPPIWRRIRVPGTMTLSQLHEVIQTAMGWMDYHLHLFEAFGVVYGDVEDMDYDVEGDEDETSIAEIAPAGSTFRYEYDFGDGWQHDIVVDEISSARRKVTPECVDGERACPPEDCGGPAGYERLLLVLGDPEDPDRLELVDEFGEFDSEEFDLDAVNEMLSL